MYTTMTVEQILEHKGSNVWSLGPSASVFDALRFMAEKNVGAVLVLKDEKPVGIFSERDCLRRVILEGRDEHRTKLSDVMTPKVIGVRLDDKIEICLALMMENAIRHLPVLDGEGRVVGFVSIGDVAKELAAEQKFLIDQLVSYISGERKKPSLPEASNVSFP
ncbi:MAG: CBS domain-containing protein [Chloroflexota bacterium]